MALNIKYRYSVISRNGIKSARIRYQNNVSKKLGVQTTDQRGIEIFLSLNVKHYE